MYKLEVITEAALLEPIITEVEDKLQILKNENEDWDIQSKKNVKADLRQARAIREAEAKRDAALATAANLPEGPQKARQLGIAETQKARLFNLNLPDEQKPGQLVVENEIEKGESGILIAYYEGVLSAVNARKAELSGR
jgi:hypothetical protein